MICFVLQGCARSERGPLPAPSSLSVDPFVDVVSIPVGTCPGFDDHFALSTKGVRALLTSIRDTETRHQLDMVTCRAAAQVAQSRERAAFKELESGEFWRRWGALIGGVIGIFVGATIPTILLIAK